MKKLYLLRHAKSGYPDNISDDHERPLNKRGNSDSQNMGRYLKEKKIFPQMIISSDAMRTKQTTENIIKTSGYDITPKFTYDLYLSRASEILKVLSSVSDQIQEVMLVSHNPGTESLARMLIKVGDPELINMINIKYPTCALTGLSFEVDSWEKIEPASAKLDFFLTPKTI